HLFGGLFRGRLPRFLFGSRFFAGWHRLPPTGPGTGLGRRQIVTGANGEQEKTARTYGFYSRFPIRPLLCPQSEISLPRRDLKYNGQVAVFSEICQPRERPRGSY